MTAAEIGIWISIVIGLLSILKIARDLGKLEGIVTTKLTYAEASNGEIQIKLDALDREIRNKLDALMSKGFLTSGVHRELCSDVTLNFNRQLVEINTTLKEDSKERERSNRILTRLEALYGRRASDPEEHSL